MNTRTLCLAILSFGETTGYEIRKSSLDGKYSYFVDASYGAIYPALNKLEADGCVTCRQEVQSGKPPRKVYAITDRGESELAEALSAPHAKDIFKSEFLLIAMCAARLPKRVIEKAIDRRIKHLEDSLTMVASIRDSASEAGTEWVTRYGFECMGRDLRHLNETKHELLAIAGTALDQNTGAARAQATLPAEAAE